ncbi:MAG: hypothetical protein LBS96_06275 [Oscillospiraceae bacterium]|jgi:uroporphyrinogen decarboxylase|nr:hypothetical protein [Oscillospiraceae bacterium]
MTGKERIARILRREPVDRIGIHEHFWGDTAKGWKDYLNGEGNLERFWDLDVCECWPLNLVADLDAGSVIVAEDENTATYYDGNRATLRKHKFKDGTPEHVDFFVKDRENWEAWAKPLLLAGALDRRINYAAYEQSRQIANEDGRYFVLSGVNVFELMTYLCGHENLLAGMALDPEWVADMVDVYSRMIVEAQTRLIEKSGLPDGIWFYDDLGYKEHPFLSPGMYDELVLPGHKRTMDFAHALGLPVILHSCGFVEPLVPGFIEAGVDCLQVIEIKAGMDLLKLQRLYGDKLCFMGGIDARVICSNDKALIDAELEAKIPVMKQGGNFIIHSDHSVPPTVKPEIFRYYLERAAALGKY